MKKTTILTLSLAFLVMLPVMALGNVWTDFQYYAEDLQNYLKDNIADTLKPAEYESQTAIDSSTGELKIPNPIAAGKRIRDDITQKSLSGTFENNPSVQATIASNEINRQITRGAVESFLGENGQERLQAKLENVESSIDRIEKSVQQVEQNQNQNPVLQQLVKAACDNPVNANASLCQNSTLTQLQLQSLKIQRDQAKMIGETFANTVQLNQSLQYSNLNLANISQQMEEANRARRVDASAETARLLRATSQADLLLVEQESEVRNQESE